MPAIELLHLTDPHLLAEPGGQLHGWHVQRAFDAVLADATRRYLDYAAIVLGGDLVDDESEAGYARLNTRLGELGRPVLAMAGNHDCPRSMARTMTAAVVHDALDVGGWRLIALDSHKPGSAAGRLGARQIEALERRLIETAAPTLIFVHHPAAPVGSRWIDAIGLEDRDTLATVLARHSQVKAVVCGHAHQAATLDARGMPCLVTPATMRQFLPGAADFAEDTTRAPGYRWLSLTVDGELASRVHRVPAASAACG